MAAAGEDMSQYQRDKLMSADYDDTPLSKLADDKIRSFQFEASQVLTIRAQYFYQVTNIDQSQVAGVFHHLITLPTYHTAALSTDNLTKG